MAHPPALTLPPLAPPPLLARAKVLLAATGAAMTAPPLLRIVSSGWRGWSRGARLRHGGGSGGGGGCEGGGGDVAGSGGDAGSGGEAGRRGAAAASPTRLLPPGGDPLRASLCAVDASGRAAGGVAGVRGAPVAAGAAKYGRLAGGGGGGRGTIPGGGMVAADGRPRISLPPPATRRRATVSRQYSKVNTACTLLLSTRPALCPPAPLGRATAVVRTTPLCVIHKRYTPHTTYTPQTPHPPHTPHTPRTRRRRWLCRRAGRACRPCH